jgi:hypothetical protein
MTNRQAATLASRLLCAWFIYSAVLDLSIIPNLVTALSQGLFLPSVLNNPTIGSRIERTFVVAALAGLFRLGVNIAAAIFFYRSDPALIRFLTGGASDPEMSETSEAVG